MHGPAHLRYQSPPHPQQSITRFSSPHSGRAELPASTVRAHAHLRNHLRHHEPHSRATPTGLCNVLFTLVPVVQTQCLCSHGGGRRRCRSSSPWSSLLLCRARPRHLSFVIRPVLVFSVSQGDVFVVFPLCLGLLSRRKGKHND